MPNTKLSALPAIVAVSGTDEFYVNQDGVSKKETLSQMATFLNTSPQFTGTPTAPTALRGTNTTQLATTAFVQEALVHFLKATSGDQSNSTISMVKVSEIDVSGVGPGVYTFEYFVRAQSSDIATTLKFAVNHTGTTSVFMYDLFFTHTGVINHNDAFDQEYNASTGAIWACQATRIKNTTLGPQWQLDTINADVLYIIKGLMIVASSGTLELYHGSSGAFATTVKVGTSLVMHKVG